MAPTASAIDVGRIPSFTFTPGSDLAFYQRRRGSRSCIVLRLVDFPEDTLRMSETFPPTPADDSPEDMTRRNFIEHVGFMSGTALLYAACKPSEPKKSATTVKPVLETSHRSLTNDEYDTVAAAVERICPRDEEPGAIDLGVPEYIDRALATPTLAHVRDDFVRGTEVLMRRAQGAIPEGLRRARPSRAGCAPHRVQGLARRLRRAALLDGAHRADDGRAVRGSGARRQPRRPRLGAHRLRSRTAGLRGSSGHHHHACETRKG